MKEGQTQTKNWAILEEIKAVIWDMDGVIAYTSPFHFQAWQEAFGEEGIIFTEQEFKRNFGRKSNDIIRDKLGEETPEDRVKLITEKKERKFRAKVADKIEPLPGVEKSLRAFKEKGLKQALASSAPQQNIQLVLGKLKLTDFFDRIVSGEEVDRGKPDPAVFLAAAQELGVSPDSCLVIEDAVAGIEAAKAAGMKCLAVTTTNPKENLKEADLVIDSLEEISIE
jgi:beta-phosphoglucomutase family hydrolase